MKTDYVNSAPVMRVKDWLITNIIAFIPLIGIIMLFVWAFGSSEINENKKNWAKSLILIQVILIALVILFYVFLIGFAMSHKEVVLPQPVVLYPPN